MRRITRVIIVIVTFACAVSLGLRPVSPAPVPGVTQPVDLKRAAVVLAYVDALRRHDAAAAASAFADNAFMVSGALQAVCSLATPCYNDRTKIRANIDGLVKIPGVCDTITSLQVTGSFVIARNEARTDALRANGIERVVQLVMFQVPQDKITVYVARNDVADPETARAFAINAGTEPKGTPITVVPPCG